MHGQYIFKYIQIGNQEGCGINQIRIICSTEWASGSKALQNTTCGITFIVLQRSKNTVSKQLTDSIQYH